MVLGWDHPSKYVYIYRCYGSFYWKIKLEFEFLKSEYLGLEAF